MADNVSPTYRPFFIARLKKTGIKMLTNSTVTAITEKGAMVSQKEGMSFLEGDAVVLAAGFKTVRPFGEEIKQKIFVLIAQS